MANKQRHDWSKYNSIEAIQEFIDQNNITQFSDLPNSLKIKLTRYGFNSQNFKFQKSRHNWKTYKTLEEIQEFIDKQFITSRTEFRNKYSGLFERSKELGLYQQLIFKNDKKSWKFLKTKSDIDNYIKNNKIIKFSDLPSSCKSRIYELGFSVSDFPNIKSGKKNWSTYNSVEDIQTFINDNKISSCTEFDKQYRGLSNKLYKLGYLLSDLNFPEKYKSTLEIKIEKFLINNNINFISQKTFDDLGKLRFDFYLPEYNLILEPGGDQHITPVECFGGKEEYNKTVERDKKKYEYCNLNNITLLYYFEFYNKEIYKNLLQKGYMGEWYVDFDKFTNRILEIIKNGKS